MSRFSIDWGLFIRLRDALTRVDLPSAVIPPNCWQLPVGNDELHRTLTLMTNRYTPATHTPVRI